MLRLQAAMVTAGLAILAGSCDRVDPNPADLDGEDRYYALVLDEVLRRGEEWWGYRAPADYCVAIAPDRGLAGLPLEESRDPSEPVLQRLGQTHPGKAFHRISRCSGYHPFRAPGGAVAGVLWVAPLETTDGVTVPGVWSAGHDMAEWGCTFVEADGAVDLKQCERWLET